MTRAQHFASTLGDDFYESSQTTTTPSRVRLSFKSKLCVTSLSWTVLESGMGLSPRSLIPARWIANSTERAPRSFLFLSCHHPASGTPNGVIGAAELRTGINVFPRLGTSQWFPHRSRLSALSLSLPRPKPGRSPHTVGVCQAAMKDPHADLMEHTDIAQQCVFGWDMGNACRILSPLLGAESDI